MLKKFTSDIVTLLKVLCLCAVAVYLTTTAPKVVTAFQVMSSQSPMTKRSNNPTADSKNSEEISATATSTALNAMPTAATIVTDQQQQHVYTSRSFKPRYTGPPEGSMTEEQKHIRQVILETRPRTGLSGPFGPWLAVPDIANPAQLLGRACRYGTTLSFRESELVILLTGAKTKSHAEFDIHVGEAIKAGISMNIINAIPRDNDFSYAAVMERVVPLLKSDDGSGMNAREWAIVQFTAELLDTYTVSDYTYAITKQALGNQDSVLVEITSIVGYYTFVSYTLNVFQIPSS
jgi:4-carboxymuconolactone decarboxylase